MQETKNVTVRELTQDELPLILPLVATRNPQTASAELRRRLEVMIGHGYHCIAVFLDDRVIGIAGYWLGARFYCGEYMDVDNVVVEESMRSSGIGTLLMEWMENKAQELGCKVVVLDSYITLAGAHKFYFGRGYHILGFHFSKDASKD